MPSKIEWTEESWNPVVGCSHCSPGCLNCYAERMAYRLKRMGKSDYFSVVDKYRGRVCWTNKIKLRDRELDKPLHWRKPRRIFVCSMSDLFHEKVPFEFMKDILSVCAVCRQHTFLVLTKRIERAAAVIGEMATRTHIAERVLEWDLGYAVIDPRTDEGWPLPNLHLGVSVCDQQEADEKIPILLQIPAAKRFVSLEPLLGPVDIEKYVLNCKDCGNAGSGPLFDFRPPGNGNSLCRDACIKRGEGPSIDWVIVGGESGPGARPMHPDWVRSIRDQCKAAGVAFFFEQWGEWLPLGQNNGRLNFYAAIMTNRRTKAGEPIYVCTDGNKNIIGRGRTTEIWSHSQSGNKTMARVGKKKAGNLLDGKIYEEYPR